MNKILGNRIKNIRCEKQITQKQMAKQLNMSLQTYVYIENGEITLTLDILSKIADVLNITISDITNVLNQTYKIECSTKTKTIFDMLDLFYANKHMCNKLKKERTLSLWLN